MATYTSIINNIDANVQQLLLPIATGLTGPSGSLPVAAKGSIAYQESDPNSIYVSNGSDWIQIQGQGATGPGVLPSESVMRTFVFNSGLTGNTGTTIAVNCSQITSDINNMAVLDMSFNQTFFTANTGTTGAIMTSTTPISVPFQPNNAKNFDAMIYLVDGSVYAGAVNLAGNGVITINFTFPAGITQFVVGGVSNVYSLTN